MSKQNGNGLLEQWREYREKMQPEDPDNASDEVRDKYQAGMAAIFESFFEDYEELTRMTYELFGAICRNDPAASRDILEDFNEIAISQLEHAVIQKMAEKLGLDLTGRNVKIVMLGAPE